MSRPLAGYIGYDAEPTTTAAPGIWTLREAEFYQRKSQWPLPPFNPSTITGLQLWLDASDASTLYDATSGGSLVAADGGVARWEDKSGSGNHATQATAGSRPARKTSVQNGLDVLRLDGSDDGLSFASDIDLSPTQSVFVVVKPASQITSAASAQYILQGGTTPTAPSATSSNLIFAFGSITGTATSETVGVYAVALNADNSVTGVYGHYSQTNVTAAATLLAYVSQGTDSDTFVGRRNDAEDFTNLTTSDQGHWRETNLQYPTKVQRVGSGASGGYLDGDICEIIIYNSALSDTDREAVENYLLAKWAIT